MFQEAAHDVLGSRVSVVGEGGCATPIADPKTKANSNVKPTGKNSWELFTNREMFTPYKD